MISQSAWHLKPAQLECKLCCSRSAPALGMPGHILKPGQIFKAGLPNKKRC